MWVRVFPHGDCEAIYKSGFAPSEVERFNEWLADAGVDCIKLIDQDQMSPDEVNAVVDEAHKHGLMVVGQSKDDFSGDHVEYLGPVRG